MLLNTITLERPSVCITQTPSGHTYNRNTLISLISQASTRLESLIRHENASCALALRANPGFVVCFLACAKIGVRVLPLNVASTKTEALELLKQSNTVVVIVDEESSGTAQAGMELGLTVMKIDKPEDELKVLQMSKTTPTAPPAPKKRHVTPESVALLLFTSGTTSKPKMVPLTQRNMCTSILNIRNHYELDSTDKCYCVMPLFHIHGLQSALFATMAGGGTVLLPEEGKFSASTFWRDVVRFEATWYTAVPTMHQILLARKDQDAALIARNKLRFIRSCSSSLPPTVLVELEEATKRPVLEAYAMTEVAHQMTSNPLPKHGPRKLGSVGRATNVQLQIAGSEDKANKPGEVCIRGDNVTNGYVDRPEANKESFDERGWFRTGDLGYLDPDGYLFIVGRLKEIVNRGGEKISPPEIDAAMLEIPGVAEAVAFGMPSAKYGEELFVAVVLKDKSKTEKYLAEQLKPKLAAFKIPSKIFLVDSIPKSATGKVQRRLLTEHFTVAANESKL